jgi:hypothetical protein
MRWIRSRRAVLLTGVLGLALLLPPSVSAEFWEPPAARSDGMVIVVGDAFLMDAFTIDIHAAVTCTLPWMHWQSATGWVKELGPARKIAYGLVWSRYPGIVCDGTPHEIFLRVPVDVAGIAFKSGKGLVALYAQVSGWDLPGHWAGAWASTGWVPVKIRQWPNSMPWPEPPLSPPMSPPTSG